ncbi:hypothetical protein [Sorangium sp. So ce1024]|uniref:hypothetical protein n=1 Tax=Sorangium sp. So ce1024 TaxID=3133327 RepID=UPI003F07797D
MGRKEKARSEPQAQGKGRIDEVDQSKGIFRLDGPHPKDAELRAPGTLGGGPYDESGRGGPAGSLEPREPSVTAAGGGVAAAQEDEPAPDGGEAEEAKPIGALPQHEEQGREERRPGGQG